MGYTYFDSPDGQDCDKKLVYMLKRAGVIGLFASTTYVILSEKPSGYFPTLARYARITFPCLAVAAAGTITVCMLTNYREKDDRINSAIGGFIGGVAGGLAKGHFGHGLAAGALFAFIAAGIKETYLNNYSIQLNQDRVLNLDDFWSKDYDYTLAKKIPKDWVAK